MIVVFDSTDSSFPPANAIVDHLVTMYNVEKYSTTVIRSEKKWSTIKGPNGHCAVEPKNMQGIENECIIYVASARELEDISPLDMVTRARNGLIIVIDCDEKIRNYDDYASWKKTIEGIRNQSTSSYAEGKMATMYLKEKMTLAKWMNILKGLSTATFVLAKKTADGSGVNLDENFEEIWKLLGKQ